MRFKNFEVLPYIGMNGKVEPTRFQIVKWLKRDEPIEVTDLITGEKKMSDTFSYVVAFIEWNNKEPCWEFTSVGTRFLEDYENGLCEYILKYLELLDAIRRTDNC